MAETDVHPEAGADEAAKIWNDMAAAEAGGSKDPAPPADAAEPNPAEAATKEAEPAAQAEADKPAGAPADQQTTTTAKTADIAAATDTGTPASATDTDIWATAPEPLRAAFEATRTERDQAQTNYRRVSGTVSGLQRKIDKLNRDLDEAKKGTSGKPASEAPSTASEDAATGDRPSGIADSEELKKAEEEFPEVVKPLKSALRALETELASARKELGGVSAKHRDDNLAKQAQTVFSDHPDYGDIHGSDEFRAWYETAPPYVRAAVERNAQHVVDGAEVSHVVKLFKTETGWKPPSKPGAAPSPKTGAEPPARPAGSTPPPDDPKRKDQLESAAGTRSRTPAVATHSDSDDPEAIWKRLAEQERRRASR